MNVRSFDNFVAIDWSGAKSERLNGIAIAHCRTGVEAPTLIEGGRRWSRSEVLAWLVNDLPPDSLVGLDLSPGLPFDDFQSFFPGWTQSPPNGKALWKFVDVMSADDPHLGVSSFVAHAEVRRHYRHGKGDCGDLFPSGSGRMRETEKRQAQQRLSPSSCFNLVGAAQVGKSSLTGMRVLHRLAGVVPVWPFDPLPEQGSVIVEIYTSIAAREAGLPKGKSKILTREGLDNALATLGVEAHSPIDAYTDHATDAILSSAWLRKNASDTTLWSPPGLDAVAQTEGWTFGVR